MKNLTQRIRSIGHRALIWTLTWLAAAATAQAQIVVNSTSDGNVIAPPWEPPPPPVCTLRDAITAANENRVVNGCVKGNPGRDTILFNIGTGTPTIRIRSRLPIIKEPVVIRGDTFGATRVELDGSAASQFNVFGQVTHGLYLTGGDSTIRNLVINRFSGNGIVFADPSSPTLPDPTPPSLPDRSIWPEDGIVDPDISELDGAGGKNAVYGCFIGTDATGTIALGNGSGDNTAGIIVGTYSNTIGGSSAADRNVISGNRGHGIILAGKGNWVRGNFIGLDVTGKLPLGNQFDGINVINPPSGQPPSANGVIGANPNPADAACGIVKDPVTGYIWDDRKQCGNRIAFNNGSGIAGGFNLFTFMANSIYSNGFLGIDVDLLGVSPNMLNRQRNFPVLTSWRPEFSTSGAVSTRVFGSINPSGKVVQFFHSPTCDPSNYGEGQTYLASYSVSGNGSFAVLLPVTGGYITATSTNGLVSTSEFSACLKI